MDGRYINEQSDARAQRSGLAALLLYILALALALFFVKCSVENESEKLLSGNSLMINLGDDSAGEGELVEATQPVPPPPSPPVPQPQPVPKQLTDERSDIEAPKPKEEPKEKPEQPTPPAPEAPAESEPESEPAPREVNRRALFPGTKPQTATASSGSVKNNDEKGEQGSPEGTPGRESTLGDGLVGNYSLSGRTLIGALPIPSYRSNSEGRVVIEITVDEDGRVTSARFRPNGSTTDDLTLTKAAREAALKARFSDRGSLLQQGTITYTFRME